MEQIDDDAMLEIRIMLEFVFRITGRHLAFSRRGQRGRSKRIPWQKLHGRRWIYTAANRYGRPIKSTLSLSLSLEMGEKRASVSKLFMRVYDQLRARIDWWKNGGESNRSVHRVRPPTHQSVHHPLYPRPRRWSIRLPGQFPPIIRSPPSCFATMYTGKFIVCPANGRSTRKRGGLSLGRFQLRINESTPLVNSGQPESLLIIAPSGNFVTERMV